MLPYRFVIKRVPGGDNIADTFSRLIEATQKNEPFDKSSPEHAMFAIDTELGSITFEEIAEASEKDVVLCKIKKCVKEDNWPAPGSKEWVPEMKAYHAIKRSLYLIGDTIVFRDKYVLPESLRKKVLKMVHRGHLGMSSMK